MILVDTSVWIDHLHRPEAKMIELLERDAVVMHDYVLAEIAMGSLADRAGILATLWQLPTAVVANHVEVMALIEAA